MIPMIMGYKEIVYLRDVICGINITAFEAPGCKFYRRSTSAQNGVYKKPSLIQLHEVRGMAKPDQQIMATFQGIEVDLFRRKNLRWYTSFAFAKKEFFYHAIVGG